MKLSTTTLALLAALSLMPTAVIRAATGQPCANQSPTGTAGEPPCNSSDGSNLFSSYTGNAHRDIVDLELFGSVGNLPLKLKRFSNTRMAPQASTTGVFGRESVWTHSYQWQMRSGGTYSNGQPAIYVGFPSGSDIIFVQSAADPTKWLPPANTAYVISQNGTAFDLRNASAEIYHFQKRTKTNSTTVFYRIESCEDAIGNVYAFTYNNNDDTLVRKVTDPSGRWLQFTYVNSAGLNENRTVLATIPYGQAAGTWYELTTTSTASYRFLTLYYSNDYHNAPALPVGEVEFYDQNNVKITGTPFGSDPYDDPTHDASKAFDGDETTFYRYAYIRNGFVGLDLGATGAKRVSRIRYFVPAVDGSTAEATAQFIGMTGSSATNVVLKSVSASDGRQVVYNYGSLTDPSGWFSWATLDSVTYPDSSVALYSYAQLADYTRPLLVHALDPRYPGAGASISYDFDSDGVVGFLQREKNGITGEVIAETAFDAAHNPKTIYPNGKIVKYAYNLTNANLASKTDGNGKTAYFTYDQTGAGHLASVKDARGFTTSFTSSDLGSPLSITRPDGIVETYTRDAYDRLLSYSFAGVGTAAITTTYTRDAQGRVTRMDYPDGTFETWTYNAYGQTLTHQRRNGGTESSSYTADGRLISSTNAVGNTTTVAYDSLDHISSVTDALGHTTSYSYNDRGQVTKLTHTDGTFLSYVYDDHGNLLSSTNEVGNTWTWTYDEYNRSVAATDPTGRTTTYAYGGVGGGCSACNIQAKPVLITLPSGKQTQSTYDLEWHITSTTQGYGTPDASTTSYLYDSNYNLTQVTTPGNKLTKYTYDSRNRVLTVTDPLNRKTTLAYDAIGRQITNTRPDAGVTSYTSDGMNRVLSITDPKLQTTSFTYDAEGNRKTLTDARSSTYTWTYDLLGRNTQLLYPDNTTEQWTFDAIGNQLTAKTRAGQLLTSTYDSRNRETGAVWSDATPAISRVYDTANRLLSSSNGLATSSYTYDAANRQLTETQANSASGQSYTVSYAYDIDGNRASLTYPSGSVVNYSYTNRNQIQSIQADGPPPLVTYTYNLDGTLANKTLESGLVTSYAYDNGYQLTGIAHGTATTTLQSYNYAYDNLGRRTSMKVNNAKWDTYGYDKVNQLTSVKYEATSTSGTSATRSVSYAYDPVGNRQSVVVSGNGSNALPSLPAGTTSYATASVTNQYTAINNLNQGYDGNGNLTLYTATVGGQPANTAMNYDAQNRLLNVQKTVGVGVNSVQITYDTRNRQVSRTVNGVTTYFVWDGWNLIEERDANGTLKQRYTQGASTDELLAKTDSSGTLYYHQDGLGSVTALSNAQGQLVETYRYDAFGRVAIANSQAQAIAVSAFNNRFLYTGREWIAEVGLYDYRNRVYSAELGRFLQHDPIRFTAGDVNLYRYCGSNSTNSRDPDGEYATAVVVIAAVALVAYGLYNSFHSINEMSNSDNYKNSFEPNEDGNMDIDRNRELSNNYGNGAKKMAADVASNMPNTMMTGPANPVDSEAGIPGWLASTWQGLINNFWNNSKKNSSGGNIPSGGPRPPNRPTKPEKKPDPLLPPRPPAPKPPIPQPAVPETPPLTNNPKPNSDPCLGGGVDSIPTDGVSSIA